MPTVGIAAGAIASGYVTKLLPVQNDKIKAAAPLAVGFLLLGKKGILGDLGAGMIAGGAISLAQSFGIGAIENPVMDLDELDTLEVEGVEDVEDVVSGTTFEEEEMQD